MKKSSKTPFILAQCEQSDENFCDSKACIVDEYGQLQTDIFLNNKGNYARSAQFHSIEYVLG